MLQPAPQLDLDTFAVGLGREAFGTLQPVLFTLNPFSHFSAFTGLKVSKEFSPERSFLQQGIQHTGFFPHNSYLGGFFNASPLPQVLVANNGKNASHLHHHTQAQGQNLGTWICFLYLIFLLLSDLKVHLKISFYSVRDFLPSVIKLIKNISASLIYTNICFK